MSLDLGEYAGTESMLQEAIAIARDMADTTKVGECLHQLGRLAIARGEYDGARAFLLESLAYYRATTVSHTIATCLEDLARVALARAAPLRRCASSGGGGGAGSRCHAAAAVSTGPLWKAPGGCPRRADRRGMGGSVGGGAAGVPARKPSPHHSTRRRVVLSVCHSQAKVAIMSIIAYIRISTEGQEDGTGLDVQRNHIVA